MAEVGNAYSGSHPLLETQVISWKSWVRRCFGGYFRTTPHDPPQQLDTAPAHRAYRVPCCLKELAACCFSEPQVPHHYRWQVNNPHVFHDRNSLVHPPQGTSWTHATQPLPLSPAQLVLTIQSHWRDWMPLPTPPRFTGACLCLYKPMD